MRGCTAPGRDGATGGAGKRRGLDNAAIAGRFWAPGRCRGGSVLPGPRVGLRFGCGMFAASRPGPQNVPLGSHPAVAFAVSADAGRLGFVAQRRLGVTQARRWGRGAQSFPLVTPSPSSAAPGAARPLRSPPFPPPSPPRALSPGPTAPQSPPMAIKAGSVPLPHNGPILTPCARQRTRRCCPVGTQPRMSPPRPITQGDV